MSKALLAGLWGLLAGSSLLLGAAVGFLAKVPKKIIAAIMAFGAGVLISALSLDLMSEAYERGGLGWTAFGFFGGAVVYTLANWLLDKRGARHRKRSGHQQMSESEMSGSGLAIALGALLDGIPESIVIGLSLIGGGSVSAVAVAAVFLSNVPEGLSSAAGMKKAGRSVAYVFGVWSAIALLSGVASLVGFVLFRDLPAGIVAATTAVAAGAILTMLSDTMIPEAFDEGRNLSGLVTVGGFLVAFWLSKLSGS